MTEVTVTKIIETKPLRLGGTEERVCYTFSKELPNGTIFKQVYRNNLVPRYDEDSALFNYLLNFTKLYKEQLKLYKDHRPQGTFTMDMRVAQDYIADYMSQ